MAIGIFKVELTGFAGAPGVNVIAMSAASFIDDNFNKPEADSAAAMLKDCYEAFKGLLAPGVKASLEPIVRVVEPSTGNLLRLLGVEQWTVNSSTAPSAGVASRATQLKCQFLTDGIRGNRGVRGGIYVGPIANTAIEQDGSVKASARATLAAAWNGALDVVGPRLVVYSRPDPNGSEPWQRVGQASFVQGVDVKTTPAVMRSRRD